MILKNPLKTGQEGFTLIELLVVIAIIGMLAAIALVSLGSARGKGRDAKRLRDIREIRTALELYYGDCGGYPANINSPIASSSSTFLATVPSNPTPPGGSYGYNTTGATSSTSVVCGSATVYSSYGLTFSLENNTATVTAGGHTASPSGIN
ncbi:MAG: type II secretion system protein [Candidatus Saccharibacteria bacterium]